MPITPITADDLTFITGTTPTIEGQVSYTGTQLQAYLDGYAVSLFDSRDVSIYAGANKIPKSPATSPQINSNFIPDWISINTDCGGGEDGDITISNAQTLTKNVRYRTVTINTGGSVISAGFDFRAQTVIINATSGAPFFRSFVLEGATAAAGDGYGVAGSTGSFNSYNARINLGGGRRATGNPTGTISNGTAGTNLGGANAIGGMGGAGGNGGNGSNGTGGSGGTSGAKLTTVFDPEAPYINMFSSTIQGASTFSTIAIGGSIGACGGGGAGNGTATGGGGGAGGGGTYIGRWKIGRLTLAAGTPAPIFACRGMNGGNGGSPPPASTNCGGGGAGGGSGGGGAIVILGIVNRGLTDAIDVTGGNGGNGGNGTGTGIGGNGGQGGAGGYIFLKRSDTDTTTILDNSATTASAGGSASGNTGGTGTVGISTKLSL